ncbi:IS1/IS1595 family N-terminal zinc-binding domain-containing protein [Prevotella bivia]
MSALPLKQYYQSGKSSIGKQRYRCKNCRKRFITDYTYKAYLPNIDN